MHRLLRLGGVEPASHIEPVDGVPIHHLELGRGEPVLLVHGAGGGAANWYRIMGGLSAQYRVLAVDLPGFGLSGSLTPKRPLGQQVAALLLRWLEQIDVRPINLVGTSFGGLTSARLAQQLKPRRLVLIDAAGLWPETSLGLRLACNRLIQSFPVKQTRRGTRVLLRHVMTAGGLEPEHEAALADYLYWSNRRTNRKAMARAYTLFAGLRGQVEVLKQDELRGLAERTLILWGEQDHFLPAPEHRRAAALAAGVELRIIPAVGHSPNWEAPDEVRSQILRFLK